MSTGGRDSETPSSDRRTTSRRSSRGSVREAVSPGTENENSPIGTGSVPALSSTSTPTSRPRYVEHDPNGVRRRGPSVNTEVNRIIGLNPDARIALQLDESKRKFVGHNARLLATEIGIVVRTTETLQTSRWKDVPQEELDRMMERLLVSIQILISII